MRANVTHCRVQVVQRVSGSPFQSSTGVTKMLGQVEFDPKHKLLLLYTIIYYYIWQLQGLEPAWLNQHCSKTPKTLQIKSFLHFCLLFLHPTVPENRIAPHSQQFYGGSHWFPVYSQEKSQQGGRALVNEAAHQGKSNFPRTNDCLFRRGREADKAQGCSQIQNIILSTSGNVKLMLWGLRKIRVYS